MFKSFREFMYNGRDLILLRALGKQYKVNPGIIIDAIKNSANNKNKGKAIIDTAMDIRGDLALIDRVFRICEVVDYLRDNIYDTSLIKPDQIYWFALAERAKKNRRTAYMSREALQKTIQKLWDKYPQLMKFEVEASCYLLDEDGGEVSRYQLHDADMQGSLRNNMYFLQGGLLRKLEELSIQSRKYSKRFLIGIESEYRMDRAGYLFGTDPLANMEYRLMRLGEFKTKAKYGTDVKWDAINKSRLGLAVGLMIVLFLLLLRLGLGFYFKAPVAAPISPGFNQLTHMKQE